MNKNQNWQKMGPDCSQGKIMELRALYSFQGGAVVKNPSINTGAARDVSSIYRLGDLLE